jgi:DNA-binding Xre family transcriptional regulator
MIHRHLDYPEGTPVTDLGDAALDDLLDCGDFDDWRPLAQAIAAEPFGALAERVLRLCDANPRYGTSPLWRAWIAHRRDLALTPPAPALPLAELRRRRGLSQAALAARVGMSQSDLSKVERRADWKVSTLAAIVAGLGLRLRIVVEDGAGHVVGTIASGSLGHSRAGGVDDGR